MELYEIKILWYSHYSGQHLISHEEQFTNINTAKRKLLELAMNDEALSQKDATLEISKDMMSAYCKGNDSDYTKFYIKQLNVNVCKDSSLQITEDELNKIITEKKNKNATLTVKIAN